MAEPAAKPVSASEVNRFCYCPWQWYYERVYGAASLRQMAKERNAALGITGGSGVFDRGRDFHKNYVKRYTWRLMGRRILFAVLLAVVLIFIALYLTSHA